MIDALLRPLAHLARQLIVAVPLCSFVALFLGSAFNEPLGRMFVFSFSIGLTCQLLIEGGRRAVAWWLARTRPDSEPAVRASVQGPTKKAHRLAGLVLLGCRDDYQPMSRSSCSVRSSGARTDSVRSSLIDGSISRFRRADVS
jgi:hypothetical protein